MVNSVLEGHLTFLIQALDWIPQVSVEVIARVVSVKKKKINYAGSENHSPHQLRKKSHFGTEYCKAPSPRKWKGKSMGISGLQAWPDIGS